MSVLEKNNYVLDVFVWDTIYLRGEAGHVSLAVREIDRQGRLVHQRHFGFWPHREFTTLDVPFHISAKEKSSLADEIHYSDQEPAFIPNKRYEITLNEEQYLEIQNEMSEQSENIKSGKTRYTWLTSVNGLFYNTFNYYNQTNLENCSTIATKIMNAGGIPVYNNSILWGISPIDVSYQLDNLIAQNKINGTCSKFASG
jgi:hypothetical protein